MIHFVSACRYSSSPDTAVKTFPERECQFSGYNEICKCQFEEFAGALTYNSVDLNLP